jgi:hypothetical protein
MKSLCGKPQRLFQLFVRNPELVELDYEILFAEIKFDGI